MTAATLIDAPIGQIRVNPLNPRKAVGDIVGLAASITSLGVLQPVLLTGGVDGGYLLRAGERRLAAALLAGLTSIPALVVPDQADVDSVLTALVENTQRRDLSPLERASGYQAALDLGGLTPTALAKRTGAPIKTVKAHLAALALGEGGQADLHTGVVTLDEALALQALEGHPDLHAKATERAGTANFPFEVQRGIKEAESRARYADLVAEGDASGVAVLPRNSGYLYSSTVVQIGRLDDKVASTHASLPCHALALGPENARWEMCTKPQAHANGKKAIADETDSETEARRAERRNVIAQNKECDAANTVRRAWIAEFLTRRTFDKTALVYAAGVLAHCGLQGDVARDVVHDLSGIAGSPYGVDNTQVGAATDNPDKALRFFLTSAIAMAERYVTNEFWRHGDDEFARHLRSLAGFGYQPCDPEIAFLAARTDTPAALAA